MQVIIPLAGQSRRFLKVGYKEPKFLIKILDSTMIEHVVSMFDWTDEFHFVVNDSQVAQFPQLVEFLTSLAPQSSVHIIEPHELGPVHSVKALRGIRSDDPIIINYCDFFLQWDYDLFKRITAGYAAVVPSFTGIHPASFGDTLYAYMRIDANGNLIELREKECFTQVRHLEHASTGTYYFSSYKLFQSYSEQLIADNFNGMAEGYVSLTLNYMVKDQLPVRIFDVDKFICWGTPEDLEQFLYNYKIFSEMERHIHDLDNSNFFSAMANIIPMAGRGSRFKDARYNTVKPMIPVNEKPMFIQGALTLPRTLTYKFVAHSDTEKRYGLNNLAMTWFGPDSSVLPIDQQTSGQAITALFGVKQVRRDQSIFISSADYALIYDIEKLRNLLDNEATEVVIFTIKLGANLIKNPNAFAYCKLCSDDAQRVIEVVEKATISDRPGDDQLVVGTFWFRDSELFIRLVGETLSQKRAVNDEFYIGNAINILIEQGVSVKVFEVDAWSSWGDPFELELHHYWTDFFERFCD